jgi:hypothetical protein
MDNQTSESSSELNMDGAAAAFGNLFEPVIEEKTGADLEAEALDELTKKPAEKEPAAEVSDDDQPEDSVIIEVDGKEVKMSKAELAEAYKNGLRQSDYTKKTMEAADTRKAADAEIQKATQERYQYQAGLQKVAAQLEGALQQQNNIDWQGLLDNDPVEYLKQQHLFQQRQAAYQDNMQQQQQIDQLNQSENAKHRDSFLRSQQEELLAKLPEWKDPAKASAEKQAIMKYLGEQGYDSESLNNITDHKAVILGRKAMLYDKMMEKASAAAKKVATIPQKVVRPGAGESPVSQDGQRAIMKRLASSGSVDDAAAAFGNYL